MDFTVKTYKKLLLSIKNSKYKFHAFEDFIINPREKVVILRHDVDKHPENSLEFAKVQNSFGIKGTYYFRITPESFNESIIIEIAKLGHEIGYHYETIDTIVRRVKNQKLQYTNQNLIDAAYAEFCKNLETFRRIVAIKTISMHGSPLSKYDNRAIWEKYDYKSLGIIGEPYFDLDFNQIFYVTDTGRSWNGHHFNARDKALKSNPVINSEFLKLNLRTTSDIIYSITNNTFPSKAMLNFHPQRWTNKPISWIQELIVQNSKNMIKYFLIRMRDKYNIDK